MIWLISEALLFEKTDISLKKLRLIFNFFVKYYYIEYSYVSFPSLIEIMISDLPHRVR